MTDTAITAATQNNLPTKTLAELKVEIKFHLGQMAGHAIEIGKLLIQAKEQVGHGNFGKWIEDNFQLSHKMAVNFMRVAERFGANLNLSSNLNQTQLITMLALPEGEEEKFIAEQAANGNPAEDMTVSQLRRAVAQYKSELEKKNSEVENLFVEKSSLESTVKTMQNNFDNLTSEKNQLEKDNAELNKRVDDVMEHSIKLQEQLENQEPIEKLVATVFYLWTTLGAARLAIFFRK